MFLNNNRSLPLLLLSPPPEEPLPGPLLAAHLAPCADAACTCPLCVPQPLPASRNDAARSAAHALLQTTAALPSAHALPIAHDDPLVASFVRLIHPPSITRSLSLPYLFASRPFQTQKQLLPSEPTAADRDDQDDQIDVLEALPSVADALAAHNPPDIPAAVAALFQNVLSKTRLGLSFVFALASQDGSLLAPDASVFSVPHLHPPLQINQHSIHVNTQISPKFNMQIPSDSSLHLSPPMSFLDANLAAYDSNASVSLLRILNDRLLHSPPSFFFGKPTLELSDPIYNPNHPADLSAIPRIRFASLPHYFAIAFNRPPLNPPTNDAAYHQTAVELPLEIDLGFYLDPSAPPPIPPTPIAKSASASPTSSTSTNPHNLMSRSPSFYRLHGFITQANAHFLAYTRMRSALTWYKCDDNSITKVDLGNRVVSRGIVFAIYRIQE